MAAISRNVYDVYNWIKKVIDSCENIQHWISAMHLCNNFHRQYPNYFELFKELRDYLDLKVTCFPNEL